MPCEPMRTREGNRIREPVRARENRTNPERASQSDAERARDSRKAKSDPECAREGQRV